MGLHSYIVQGVRGHQRRLKVKDELAVFLYLSSLKCAQCNPLTSRISFLSTLPPLSLSCRRLHLIDHLLLVLLSRVLFFYSIIPNPKHKSDYAKMLGLKPLSSVRNLFAHLSSIHPPALLGLLCPLF